VWNLSDLKMSVGLISFLIPLVAWVVIRIRKMPKLPRPRFPPFSR
jgi:hypothetical protein